MALGRDIPSIDGREEAAGPMVVGVELEPPELPKPPLAPEAVVLPGYR